MRSYTKLKITMSNKTSGSVLLLLAVYAMSWAQAFAPVAAMLGHAGITQQASASSSGRASKLSLPTYPRRFAGKRVGLITNNSAIDRSKTPDIDLIAKHKDLKLVALLAPEHGIRGTVEAGEKIVDETDTKTGVPIYSLYLSEDRGPTTGDAERRRRPGL